MGKNTFPATSSFIGCVFSIFSHKNTVLSVRNGYEAAYCRADTMNNSKKIDDQKIFHITKELVSSSELNKLIKRVLGYMLKCTSGFTAHRLETIILLCSSFLLGRSETVSYSLVALLLAALQSEWEWVSTELFPCWLETAQHNSTDWNEIRLTSLDWMRWSSNGINTHSRSHAW